MKKILLIDDTLEYRENFSNFFKTKSYQAHCVDTEDKALSMLKKNKEKFDYVVIDLQLDNKAEYAGIGIFLSIKVAYPDMRVIIVSGFLLEEVRDSFNKETKASAFHHIKESSLKEFENNYIYKGSEDNHFDSILSKIKQFEPEEHFYALLIAINDYEYIPKLRCPIKETHELKKVLLSHYSFNEDNIIMLEDATRRDIFEQLELLTKKLKENDSLIIYYSGHACWEEESEQGYWLTKNAEKSNRAEWMTYNDVYQHVKRMAVKHFLLINDACYAGGATREYENSGSLLCEQIFQKKSRRALTSGALHPVPDNSIFAKYLLQFLKNNIEKYLSAFELSFQIHQSVRSENKEHYPVYNTITALNKEDEGGHFVFVRKSS